MVKCVMCKNEAKYMAIAKYKSGEIEEPLCEECTIINEGIKRDKLK